MELVEQQNARLVEALEEIVGIKNADPLLDTFYHFTACKFAEVRQIAINILEENKMKNENKIVHNLPVQGQMVHNLPVAPNEETIGEMKKQLKEENEHDNDTK